MYTFCELSCDWFLLACPQILDRYLRESQTHFKDLFAEFDRDRSGHLDSGELQRLVQRLMPAVTTGQLMYFEVRIGVLHLFK